MRRILIAALFLACMPFSSLAADFPEPGKVCIINLSDNHCIPCKMMSKMVEKMQDEYQGKVVSITINALKDRDAAAKYKPHALPTMIFFNVDGQEVRRYTGVMEEEAMRAQIESMIVE